jgi:hypothetical protein
MSFGTGDGACRQRCTVVLQVVFAKEVSCSSHVLPLQEEEEEEEERRRSSGATLPALFKLQTLVRFSVFTLLGVPESHFYKLKVFYGYDSLDKFFTFLLGVPLRVSHEFDRHNQCHLSCTRPPSVYPSSGSSVLGCWTRLRAMQLHLLPVAPPPQRQRASRWLGQLLTVGIVYGGPPGVMRSWQLYFLWALLLVTILVSLG